MMVILHQIHLDGDGLLEYKLKESIILKRMEHQKNLLIIDLIILN